MIFIPLLLIFKSVNYEPFEIKLSIKSLLGQELTLEEMKNSNIFNAYKQITFNTNVEEINNILNKKSKNIGSYIETWYFPYGYVSILYREKEKKRVVLKLVEFETQYTSNINEKELKALFKCDSLEEIINMLGEPAIMEEEYNIDGEIILYYYEWGIETKYSEEFIKITEKYYDDNDNISLNNKKEGKFHLSVSIKPNKKIEKFSLTDY